MMTNFARSSIIDVWWGPQYACECNSIRFYKNVAADIILRNGNVHCTKNEDFL